MGVIEPLAIMSNNYKVSVALAAGFVLLVPILNRIYFPIGYASDGRVSVANNVYSAVAAAVGLRYTVNAFEYHHLHYPPIYDCKN